MVDIRAIPVSRENIEKIQSTGAIIYMESKCLNAVPISASFEQNSSISNLFCKYTRYEWFYYEENVFTEIIDKLN